jgi:hypothetical protein
MRNRPVIETKETDLTVKGNVTKNELAEIDEAVRLLKESRRKEQSADKLMPKNLN